jgi:hypothetical protein
MDGLPDAEVQGDLQASLLLVVGGGHLDDNRDAPRVCVHVAERDDAIGSPQVAEERFGEARIAEEHDHPLTVRLD